MSLWRQQSDFSYDVSKLIQYIEAEGYYCTFGETYRTPEQAKIYAQEGKGIVDSLHCRRLAVDLNIFNYKGVYLTKTEDYEPFGLYWESLSIGNRWGGNFKRADGNHFERKYL